MKEPDSREGLVIAVTITSSGAELVPAGAMEASLPSKPSAYGLSKIGEEILRPNVWLRITPDNIVTVIVSKSEMGQGISTALPMIVADELEADWKKVRFEMSPAGEEYKDPEWGTQTTGGSTSVRHLYGPLRRAGAAAREMLIKAASELWGVSPEECEAVKGKVKNKKNGKSFTYGKLCLKAAKMPVPKNPQLKRATPSLIGKSLHRLDVRDKVEGTAVFGTDVFISGMLYGVIARRPAYGAKVISYDGKAATKIPGVRNIVKTSGGIGICADTLDAAIKGRDAVKIEWGKGADPDLDNETLEKNYFEHIDKKGVIARKQGDARGSIGKAAQKIEATYFLPYLAHAPIEPMNATAFVGKGKCEIWAPTQSQSDIIQAAVNLTGLKPEKIYVHTTYLGGGFGRRLESDYAEEAVELSKATGKPVKLFWTREEDLKNDFYRPACCCKMEGGIDSKGRFIAWSQKVVVPSIFSRAYSDAIKSGVDPAAVEGLVDTEYEVPNIFTEYVKIEAPIPVGFWRSVGHSHNAFVVECFIDEVALAAGKDPLDFRISLLKKHPRVRRVLEVAAEKAEWGKSLKKGIGRGIAQHFSYGSYVAQVAEVTVDEKSGKVKVNRIVCAVDCGPVINPDILTAQIEGGIIFGLSAALKEEVLFASGGVKTSNFNNYRILRMNEAPEIEVHIVESKEKIGGIGEVGVPPIAPAVANAVFSATGIRLRYLPMKAERVREAMKGRCPLTKKNIFITGLPGVGKTTLIKRIADELKGFHPAGFYTTEIREAGIRKGFELISLDGKRGILSHVDIESPHRVGKYRVDIKGFEDFLDSIPFLDPAGGPIIIDEIGKMECLSDKFRLMIKDILDSARLVIATIALKGGGVISEIKKRNDVRFFEITEINRNTLLSEVFREVKNLLLKP